jgi:hypothetical protein
MMGDASVTLKLQLTVPVKHPFGAVQLTVVVPSAKTEPEGGVQTAVDGGLVPLVAGVGYVTTLGAVALMQVLGGQERVLGTHGAAAHENVMPSY